MKLNQNFNQVLGLRNTEIKTGMKKNLSKKKFKSKIDTNNQIKNFQMMQIVKLILSV
jgi:hypothetical protein